MALGTKLRSSHPKILFFWLALHAREALLLPSHSVSLFNTPQLAARAEQAVTLKPYTGNGAVYVMKYYVSLAMPCLLPA